MTSEINTNNCACVLLKVPIGAQVTVAGLIALPSTYIPHLRSHGWLATRQLHQVLLQTHETLVQCPSVLQRKDEHHRPVGSPWPEIRLDVTGVASRESFRLADLRFCFVVCGRFTLG